MADTARVDNDVTFEPDTIFAPVGDTLDWKYTVFEHEAEDPE